MLPQDYCHIVKAFTMIFYFFLVCVCDFFVGFMYETKKREDIIENVDYAIIRDFFVSHVYRKKKTLLVYILHTGLALMPDM